MLTANTTADLRSVYGHRFQTEVSISGYDGSSSSLSRYWNGIDMRNQIIIALINDSKADCAVIREHN
jgi:hypothetical protein